MKEMKEMKGVKKMKEIIIEAENIEAAKKEISQKWTVPEDELEARIIQEAQKGFLGLKIFSRKMKVEIKHKVPEQPSQPQKIPEQELELDLMAVAKEYLENLLKHMNLTVEVEIENEDTREIEIKGEDAADYVVGRYGDCLKSLEYILNLSLRDPKHEPRIKIDSCGYRERRIRNLERLAHATARQAVKYSRPVRLDPMESWERWVLIPFSSAVSSSLLFALSRLSELDSR